jgi:hypothetical protein
VRLFLFGMIAGLVALGAPVRASAQDDPRLTAALSLAQEGLPDSARAVVNRLLATIPPTDTLYPAALYTAGSVAGTALDMQRLFQRVAIEYAWSPYADDALLRLAQLDYAANDLGGAVRNLEAIRQDYPGSSLIPTAALWAARAHFGLGDVRAGCGWLAAGLALVGEDVELENRLQFHNRRCTVAEEAAAADSAPRDSAAAEAYRVQVLATRSREAAEEFLPRVAALGYAARIVADGPWFKVQLGAFPDEGSARAAAERIRGTVGGSPFVVHGP